MNESGSQNLWYAMMRRKRGIVNEKAVAVVGNQGRDKRESALGGDVWGVRVGVARSRRKYGWIMMENSATAKSVRSLV